MAVKTGSNDVYLLSTAVAECPEFTFRQEVLKKAFTQRYGGLKKCVPRMFIIICVVSVSKSWLGSWALSDQTWYEQTFRMWVWLLPAVCAASCCFVNCLSGVTELNSNDINVHRLLLSSLPVYSLHQFEEHVVDCTGKRSAFQGFLDKQVAKVAGLPEETTHVVGGIYLFLVNVYGIWCMFPFAAWLASRYETDGTKVENKTRNKWYPLLMVGLVGNVGVPFFNAFIHAAAAIRDTEYNPGLATAIFAFIPMTWYVFIVFYKAGLVDMPRVIAVILMGFVAHILVFVPLVLCAKGFLSSTGVCATVVLMMPALLCVSAAIPPVNRDPKKNSYWLTFSMHTLLWHMGLAKLSPRLLKSGVRIFEQVQVESRIIVPPDQNMKNLFKNVGQDYRKMLEKARPIFTKMCLDSAKKVLKHQDLKAIGWLFFASDSTLHFINALPNFAIHLVQELSLSEQIRHSHLSLMGCCGGLQTLHACIGTLMGKRKERGLVVLFEATGTQSAVRQDILDHHDLLQLALFGDGSAAALFATGPLSPEESAMKKLKFISHQCTIVDGTMHFLSHANHWDHVYSVVETNVPEAIQHTVPNFVQEMLKAHSVDISKTAFLVHPGGPRILTTIEKELKLLPSQLAHSWRVLRQHGNMSGVTNLAVIDAFLNDKLGETARFSWAISLAFGPGICVQAILFEVDMEADPQVPKARWCFDWARSLMKGP